MPLLSLCWNSPGGEYHLTEESSHSLSLLTSILFIIISTHVLCILPIQAWCEYGLHTIYPNYFHTQVTWTDLKQAILTRRGAWILFTVWLLAFCTFIVENEQE